MRAPRPRIIFVIGRGGGGHKAACRAVRDCLPADVQNTVEVLDGGYAIEAAVYGRKQLRTSGFDMDELYNLLLRYGFLWIASTLGILAKIFVFVAHHRIARGLQRMWEDEPPQVVVSFVPYLNAIFRDALAGANPDAKLITVVTDFASSPSHCWIDPCDPKHVDRHHIVAGTPTLQRQCADLGYPKDSVLSTGGMVVHPCFHAARNPGTRADRALISFGAFPPMRVEKIVVALALSQPQLELVVLCGGNEALLNRLRARGDVTAESMLPAEAVRNHMAAATFVVGKPGPGTVTEAIACGAVVVSENRGVMPQEVEVRACSPTLYYIRRLFPCSCNLTSPCPHALISSLGRCFSGFRKAAAASCSTR